MLCLMFECEELSQITDIVFTLEGKLLIFSFSILPHQENDNSLRHTNRNIKIEAAIARTIMRKELL